MIMRLFDNWQRRFLVRVANGYLHGDAGTKCQRAEWFFLNKVLSVVGYIGGIYMLYCSDIESDLDETRDHGYYNKNE